MVKSKLVHVKPGQLRLDHYENDDEPSETDVLIDVAACGICGSDLHWHLEGKLGPFLAKDNAVLGHEASGTIIKVGSKVTKFKPGDRVCIEPCEPCWKCDLCRIGSNNLCHTADNLCCGGKRDGFFRSTNVWPEILCHKLADNMTLQEGAVVEPVACAVWGVRRTKLEGNEKILITGSGPIGLLTLMVAKAFGCGKICITDVNNTRLSIAKDLGADYSLLVDPKSGPSEIAAKVHEIMGGPPDVAIDCTGMGSCIDTGILAVRRGGKVTMMGLSSRSVTTDLSTASLREVDLIAVARYNNSFPTAIDLISSGRVNVKALISHVINLNDYQQAFDTLVQGRGVKVLLVSK